MRRLIWPVLFLFLFLLQGAASVFYTGWLAFDLPLLCLYGYALLRGKEMGGLTGAAVGLVQDALTVGVFGFHILSRALVGYTIGMMHEKIVKGQHSFHVAAIAACSLGLRFLFWWLELLRSGFVWRTFPSFLWESLGYCLGNMLLIVPMLYLVRFIYNWIKSEDISY